MVTTPPPSLLPSNATPMERALAQVIGRISDVPVPVADLWSPADCPAPLLPWLAWALSVDEWSPEWSEAQRREAIAASVEIHRHKGSMWAVRRALDVMGYGDCDITEGRASMVGGAWTVGDSAVLVGGAGHWAEYWVTVRAPVTPAAVAAIARRLASIVPARCRLTRIDVDAVTVVVGGPWAVGDAAVTVGATYPTSEIL